VYCRAAYAVTFEIHHDLVADADRAVTQLTGVPGGVRAAASALGWTVTVADRSVRVTALAGVDVRFDAVDPFLRAVSQFVGFAVVEVVCGDGRRVAYRFLSGALHRVPPAAGSDTAVTWAATVRVPSAAHTAG
jgi:hypothetical protein